MRISPQDVLRTDTVCWVRPPVHSCGLQHDLHFLYCRKKEVQTSAIQTPLSIILLSRRVMSITLIVVLFCYFAHPVHTQPVKHFTDVHMNRWMGLGTEQGLMKTEIFAQLLFRDEAVDSLMSRHSSIHKDWQSSLRCVFTTLPSL